MATTLAIGAALMVAFVPLASADVQRNGWGFGIADDDGASYANLGSTPSLEENFRRLQPRFFRLML
ncbi:MAG TPA: hypothetical protein VEQ41_02940, partial [Solirubrobacterales bacterium]|nr:hypothetical protein [Solirubrobacterales bacterium]